MTFEAKYPGRCACGDPIDPGDLCTYTEDDEIAHAECNLLDGPTNIHAAETPCPDCHLVHAGGCDW